MNQAPTLVSPGWLALREPADAAARSAELVAHLRHGLPADQRSVIYDLGCGTGSMARWLAPQLPGAQRWLLYDRDPTLLAHAAAAAPAVAADESAVTVETRAADITRLEPADLAGATLITAAALLDMLTAEELGRLVTSCVEAACPALITVSVVGRVDLVPADPLDERIVDSFNAHQRRTVAGRRLLGPDAVTVAADLFAHHGAEVLLRPSPWRLDARCAALTAEWLSGWVAAAREQEPELSAAADAYLNRRLADLSAGRLDVMVHHLDLLALPG
jgi:SAM-dependent methyltransferase